MQKVINKENTVYHEPKTLKITIVDESTGKEIVNEKTGSLVLGIHKDNKNTLIFYCGEKQTLVGLLIALSMQIKQNLLDFNSLMENHLKLRRRGEQVN